MIAKDYIELSKYIYTQNFVIVRHGVLELTLTINSGRELEVIGKPWI